MFCTIIGCSVQENAGKNDVDFRRTGTFKVLGVSLHATFRGMKAFTVLST